MPIYRLNTKIRLTMLCLSGFELYSRWVPLHKSIYSCVDLKGKLGRLIKISLLWHYLVYYPPAEN